MKRILLIAAAFLLPFSAAAQTSDESGFSANPKMPAAIGVSVRCGWECPRRR